MVIKLYRSGALTPLEAIPVKNPWFDTLSASHRLTDHSPRSSSVFVCRSVEEAEMWIPWRQDMLLDANLWEITLPDNVTGVFGHFIHYYETAGFLRSMPEYAVEGVFERSIEEYWTTGFPITEATLTQKFEDFVEVLLPYHIAVEAKWTLLREVPPVEFDDEPTYFDEIGVV